MSPLTITILDKPTWWAQHTTVTIHGNRSWRRQCILRDSPLESVHHATKNTPSTSWQYLISLVTISSKFLAFFCLADMSTAPRMYGYESDHSSKHSCIILKLYCVCTLYSTLNIDVTNDVLAIFFHPLHCPIANLPLTWAFILLRTLSASSSRICPAKVYWPGSKLPGTHFSEK